MFAQMMIPHHQQAVQMADLATTRASSPVIKELAAQIKGAQQPEIDQMSAWLAEWGVPVLDGEEAMSDHGDHGMSGMLTDAELQTLADAQGAEFDRLFAEYMIKHHEGAIEMAEPVVGSADPRESSPPRMWRSTSCRHSWTAQPTDSECSGLRNQESTIPSSTSLACRLGFVGSTR
jgi:uncharacterized protein (DUF305 family)